MIFFMLVLLKGDTESFIFVAPMKLRLYKILFFLIFFNNSSIILSQYYDSAIISNIHANKTAAEGDFYLDTIRNQFYIGLTSGEVGRIVDSNYVSGIVENHLDTTEGSVFAIWAEESAGLSANAFEWAYGNGEDSDAGFGIVVPFDCELFAVGLTLLNGTAEVEVYRNGSSTGAVSGTANSGSIITTLNNPLQINAGDVINFMTLSASGATGGGKAVAWFKVVNKIPTYTRYNGSGTPTVSIGKNGDEYLDNTNGDLYIKEGGVWINKLNIKGPPGADTAHPIIQVTNTLSGNINSGTVTFNWINTLTSSHISNTTTDFLVTTDGITVVKAGLYKATVFQYQEATSGARNNAALRVLVNGTPQGGYGANSYQRLMSGHDESTASLTTLVRLAAGDKVGIRNDQLADNGNVICPAGTLIFILEKL